METAGGDETGASSVLQRPPLDDEQAVREWLTRRRLEHSRETLSQRRRTQEDPAATTPRRRRSNPDRDQPAPSLQQPAYSLSADIQDTIAAIVAFFGWLAIWISLSASLVLPVLVVVRRGIPPVSVMSAAVLGFAVAMRLVLACAYMGRGPPPNGRRRGRNFHIPSGVSAERAAYMRAAHRLAYVDRDFSAADYEALLELDHNNQRLKRFLEGASQGTIDSLPSYPYSGRTAEEAKACDLQADLASGGHKESATACSICLEHFSNDQSIRILPCFHQFHVNCVDRWLLQQGRCPVCKASIVQENHLYSEAL